MLQNQFFHCAISGERNGAFWYIVQRINLFINRCDIYLDSLRIEEQWDL